MTEKTGIVERRVKETRKEFNLKRWKELFKEPPKTLTLQNKTFKVDQDCFRKWMQYVYDMVFKTQDVFGLFGGIEGSGKSTDASQVGYCFWYILNECNVLRKDLGTYYEYSEENCLAHNLEAFMDLCDLYNDDLWRIIICDEAGDLKGEDRWEETNKAFRDDMRKDRKKLRVRLMCYPQPWELVKDFTLGRTNFVRINRFSKNKDGFGSDPDTVDTILIPRGDFTYSFHTNEVITRGDIKKILLEVTKERYTSEIPKKYVFKTSKKEDVFMFDAEKYIKRAKEENRTKRNTKKIVVTPNLMRIFANYLTPNKIGLSTKIDPSLSYEEKKIKQQEKKDANLIYQFVHSCKESLEAKEKRNS